MINAVNLLGNIGNIDSKTTPSGVAVCEISLATNETWTDKSGEKQTKVSWHNVMVYGKRAETCTQYLAKGKQIFVSGKLNYASWDKTDGTKGYKTEIIADDVQFIGGKIGSENTHRIVVEAFRGKIEKGMTVDHVNGKKHDNRLTNLEVVAAKTNSQRAVALGLIKPKKGVASHASKLTQAQVDIIRECYKQNKGFNRKSRPFSTAWLGKAFGMTQTGISSIVRGRTHKDSFINDRIKLEIDRRAMKVIKEVE